MYKAVILDLNGVFLVSPKLSDRVEKDFGVPNSVFLPQLFEIMDKVRQPGAAKAFTYWQPALVKWGVTLSEQEWWDYWFKAEVPSEPMITLARTLRARGIKVIILSNNFKERADYYGHYPWLREVADKVYFSWVTGYVKPDARAWELVLSENNLKPEECLYFDDQEKNLNVAAGLGITSHKFTGVEDCQRVIGKSFELP